MLIVAQFHCSATVIATSNIDILDSPDSKKEVGAKSRFKYPNT